jgi:hypothetical protein
MDCKHLTIDRSIASVYFPNGITGDLKSKLRRFEKSRYGVYDVDGNVLEPVQELPSVGCCLNQDSRTPVRG